MDRQSCQWPLVGNKMGTVNFIWSIYISAISKHKVCLRGSFDATEFKAQTSRDYSEQGDNFRDGYSFHYTDFISNQRSSFRQY